MIPWRNWSNSRCPVFLVLLTFVPMWGQDLDYYFSLAYQGKVEEVAEALPQLYDQHPDDGTVLYLEGLITRDGDDAIDIYKRVARLYPSSPYADDAILKIGEYLYSRGLYVQAAQYLKRIPVHYPRSDLVYPGVRLFLNAMLVSGNRDTALFYAQVFSRKYSEIEFDLEAGKAFGGPESHSQIDSKSAVPGPGAPRRTDSTPPKDPGTMQRFKLQVGAFSVQENAERQKALLESLNYRVEIIRTRSGDRILHIVMVIGFRSREDAEMAGRLLKENYGISYLVLSED
ncbi:MAG: SPOR domain-containing protein [Fidelibacterota bacterium]|nr:MAG: SPOR domain-containing protein [Candidatus Neomarinimicrobiota bacterium]